ncbi:uncharacterized protein plekhn1 isoform X2 [Scyliorhinus canicula]|uniref:uncharacterized protein plekhn1 isoform X2 n=1 Tax=Scyliorhinus canicula TaxID=7830 RepID=UPI0018F3BD75|nr:uncharacterized protein plekhn1 isoform X2 [Scyliorhinus canicula]
MGNKLSCIPKRRQRPRKRAKTPRNEWDQERPDIYAEVKKKPATNQNQPDSTPQAQTRPAKEPKQNDKVDIESRLLNYPIIGWKESGVKLEDLGKMIHYSRVKICHQPCKDINDRCLALFQNHLIILSEDFRGFSYQGMLALAGIMGNSMENTNSTSEQNHAFQITGPLIHPFTVYCSTEEQVKEWLYHLSKQRQVNSKVVDAPRTQACRALDNRLGQPTKNVDVRTLILNRPIQGGERGRIDSLGSIAWISEAKLQHLPSQDQHDCLLILFSTTLLILSEEHQVLHYKGELPLNSITIFEEDESDNDPYTFLIVGKMINHIMVTSKNRTAHQNIIHHLDSAGVRVQKASQVNKGRDCKRSPECRAQLADKHRPSLEPHSSPTVYGIFTFPQKPVEMISVSEDLPTPVTDNALGPLTSPDYAEPYTPPPRTFLAPAEPLKQNSSAYKHNSSPLPIRGSSMRFSDRRAFTLSQPPPLPSERCWSPAYAEPFTARRMQPLSPGNGSSHRDMVNSQDSSKKHPISGSNISRLSPISMQPCNNTNNYCSPLDKNLNNLLSPTYAVPYVPFKLRPAPPAKPVWLRESMSRPNSSSLPHRGGDRNVPLRETLALPQSPAKPNCGFGKDLNSFTARHRDVPLSPLYAQPFKVARRQLAPPTVSLSAAGLASKQNGSLVKDQWSNMHILGLERLPRSSLPSSSLSGSSSCSYLEENPLTNPLSPPYAEPYLPQSMFPADHFWMTKEGSPRGSTDFSVQCLKDDSSEYYAIIQLLDSYREGRGISWYSDDSRFSMTSSEHTYAELESVPDDSDYEFWEFDIKQQDIPHLSAPTLMKLRQRGINDSRLQGRVHRWS